MPLNPVYTDWFVIGELLMPSGLYPQLFLGKLAEECRNSHTGLLSLMNTGLWEFIGSSRKKNIGTIYVKIIGHKKLWPLTSLLQ